MTIPRVVALFEHFSISPPLHVMVAAYLGVGQRHAAPKQDLGELLSMLGPGGKLRG